ncbi:hypothetical protein DRK59_20045 [Salmonella enterica subsp. diarizonae]|uniref:Uncharacterized protein n=1 Tax=Salmonella enterica TaxID=28901 RepID=A0A743P0M5_SALER|nr:hypothetical protein [Salmonella enterica subsp. diarizonae]EGT7826326.1 hypothetical protein [Salmonella enterica]MDJ6543336.1 hypothetical protein [Salmonella enterica]MLU19350.1 hypothetical protein [Salmonella enterica subsp. diarizonae]HAF2127148.1 hypothetical protein [Salmonella enterica]
MKEKEYILSPISSFKFILPLMKRIKEDVENNEQYKKSDTHAFNQLNTYLSDFIKQESFEHRYMQALKYSYLYNIKFDKESWSKSTNDKHSLTLVEKQFEKLKRYVGRDPDYMGIFEYNTDESVKLTLAKWKYLRSLKKYKLTDKFFKNIEKEIFATEPDEQKNKKFKFR